MDEGTEHGDFAQAAQLARLAESLNNQREDMRDVKVALERISQAMLQVTSMQRDLIYVDEKIRYLLGVADQRTPAMAALDKRVTSLERWNRLVGAVLLASTGIVGWGVQKVEYVHRLDNRVAILELLVNGKQVERAMAPGAAAVGEK